LPPAKGKPTPPNKPLPWQKISLDFLCKNDQDKIAY